MTISIFLFLSPCVVFDDGFDVARIDFLSELSLYSFEYPVLHHLRQDNNFETFQTERALCQPTQRNIPHSDHCEKVDGRHMQGKQHPRNKIKKKKKKLSNTNMTFRNCFSLICQSSLANSYTSPECHQKSFFFFRILFCSIFFSRLKVFGGIS